MTTCLKCDRPATLQTADTDEPLCWAHGGGEPPDVDYLIDRAQEYEGPLPSTANDTALSDYREYHDEPNYAEAEDE